MTERYLHHWTVHHIMDDDKQIVSLKLPFHKVVAGLDLGSFLSLNVTASTPSGDHKSLLYFFLQRLHLGYFLSSMASFLL